MKNFLECVKCSSPKIRIDAMANKKEKVGVRLKCECGAEELFYVPEKDFIVWVASPEITAAIKVFEKPKKAIQGALW